MTRTGGDTFYEHALHEGWEDRIQGGYPPPTSSMAAAQTDGPSEQNILVFYECVQNVYHDINHVDTKYAS